MLLFRNHCNDFALLDNKKKFLYYLIASEICPGNRGGLIRAWPSCGEKGGYGCKLT
jgi:hypothetical protein